MLMVLAIQNFIQTTLFNKQEVLIMQIRGHDDASCVEDNSLYISSSHIDEWKTERLICLYIANIFTYFRAKF